MKSHQISSTKWNYKQFWKECNPTDKWHIFPVQNETVDISGKNVIKKRNNNKFSVQNEIIDISDKNVTQIRNDTWFPVQDETIYILGKKVAQNRNDTRFLVQSEL